jgi:hypothetical protein
VLQKCLQSTSRSCNGTHIHYKWEGILHTATELELAVTVNLSDQQQNTPTLVIWTVCFIHHSQPRMRLSKMHFMNHVFEKTYTSLRDFSYIKVRVQGKNGDMPYNSWCHTTRKVPVRSLQMAQEQALCLVWARAGHTVVTQTKTNSRNTQTTSVLRSLILQDPWSCPQSHSPVTTEQCVTPVTGSCLENAPRIALRGES